MSPVCARFGVTPKSGPETTNEKPRHLAMAGSGNAGGVARRQAMALRRRRRATPARPKPVIIKAQVAGSGTAGPPTTGGV